MFFSPHIFSIVRLISHCIQHCNWPLCFIMSCMCYKMYAVWCICLIWHNGAYVHSLSRGATCHGRPPLLRTSSGRRWQVLLYSNSYKNFCSQIPPSQSALDNTHALWQQWGQGCKGLSPCTPTSLQLTGPHCLSISEFICLNYTHDCLSLNSF